MTYSYQTFCSNTITAEEFAELEQFVSEAEHSNDPAAVNMGWREPAGLLYNIKQQQRWRSDQGLMVLVKDQDQPVAVSGVEYPENSQQWAIGGVRTWITASHRSRQLANFFLNIHYQWSLARGCNFMLLTFNDYNRAAWHAVDLKPKYRRVANWSNWWDDCYAVPDRVQVRHIMQWCVIKPVVCKDNAMNNKQLLDWSSQINT